MTREGKQCLAFFKQDRIFCVEKMSSFGVEIASTKPDTSSSQIVYLRTEIEASVLVMGGYLVVLW